MNFKKVAMIIGGLAILGIIAAQASAGVLSNGGGSQQLIQLEADQQQGDETEASVSTNAKPQPTQASSKPDVTAKQAQLDVQATQIAVRGAQVPVSGPTPAPPSVSDAMRRPGALVLLNPANARPGASVGVTGNGFDPGSQINVTLKRTSEDKGTDLGFVQADSGGAFGGFAFTLPQDFTSGQFSIFASQQNGTKQANATGRLVPNSPTVKLGTQVGQPGDEVAFSVNGFAPDEAVQVFFNSLNTDPIAQFKTDKAGNLRLGKFTIPVGAVGNNSLIFVGEKSQSPVTEWFLMLNLYPVVELSSYASRADHTLGINGKGFGPSERIRVHLNTVDAPPIGVVQADGKGNFTQPNAFTIPFELKGKNTLIFIGEQTQAPATTSFDVLPYAPNAEASTYGGRPGTTVAFYGTGFAREEVVHVFVGRSQNNAGREVSCFTTDKEGNVRAGGSYTIPSTVKAGKLTFNLVGSRSGAQAGASMEVTETGGSLAVNIPEQQFTCELSDEAPADPAPPAPTSGDPSVEVQTQPNQAAPAAGNNAAGPASNQPPAVQPAPQGQPAPANSPVAAPANQPARPPQPSAGTPGQPAPAGGNR